MRLDTKSFFGADVSYSALQRRFSEAAGSVRSYAKYAEKELHSTVEASKKWVQDLSAQVNGFHFPEWKIAAAVGAALKAVAEEGSRIGASIHATVIESPKQKIYAAANAIAAYVVSSSWAVSESAAKFHASAIAKIRYYQSGEMLSPELRKQIAYVQSAIARQAAILTAVLVGFGVRVALFAPRVPSLLPTYASLSLGIFGGLAMKFYQDEKAHTAFKTGGLRGLTWYIAKQLNPLSLLSRVQYGVETYFISINDLRKQEDLKEKYPGLSKLGDLETFMEEQRTIVDRLEINLRKQGGLMTDPKNEKTAPQLAFYYPISWAFIGAVLESNEKDVKTLVLKLQNMHCFYPTEKELILRRALCVALCEGNQPMAELLLKYVSIPRDVALMYASFGGNLALVNSFLNGYEEGLNVDQEPEEFGYSKPSFLGQRPDISILPQTLSPIQAAALRGHKAVLERLLPLSKNLSHQGFEGHSLLGYAALSGSSQVFNLVHNEASYREAIQKGFGVEDHLYVAYNAIMGGNADIVRAAIDDLMEQVKDQDSDPKAVAQHLLEHAAYAGEETVIDMLVKEYGIEVPFAALSSAALGGKGATFKKLLAIFEAQLEKKQKTLTQEKKNYLLYSALQATRIDPVLVKGLIDLGAVMSVSFSLATTGGREVKRSSFYNAVVQLESWPDLVVQLLDTMTPRVRMRLLKESTFGALTLTASIKHQNSALFEKVVAASGASLAKNGLEWLQRAVSSGKEDICKLLANQVNPFEALPHRRVSPMILAIWGGQREIAVEFLKTKYAEKLSLAVLKRFQVDAKQILNDSKGRWAGDDIYAALEDAIRVRATRSPGRASSFSEEDDHDTGSAAAAQKVGDDYEDIPMPARSPSVSPEGDLVGTDFVDAAEEYSKALQEDLEEAAARALKKSAEQKNSGGWFSRSVSKASPPTKPVPVHGQSSAEGRGTASSSAQGSSPGFVSRLVGGAASFFSAPAATPPEQNSEPATPVAAPEAPAGETTGKKKVSFQVPADMAGVY